MQVRNKRPWAVEIAATEQFVDAGAVADVDDDLGASLCEQEDSWEPVTRAAPKAKPAPAGESESTPVDEED